MKLFKTLHCFVSLAFFLGCFNTTLFEAQWDVDIAQRIVNFKLRTRSTRQDIWLGLGISNDDQMVGTMSHCVGLSLEGSEERGQTQLLTCIFVAYFSTVLQNAA